MKKVLLLFTIILSWCAISRGQTERIFTVNNELPSSLVTSLARDSIGDIWIGTENGLCRYHHQIGNLKKRKNREFTYCCSCYSGSHHLYGKKIPFIVVNDTFTIFVKKVSKHKSM